MAVTPRTSAERVRGVLLQNYDSARSPNLTPFIRVASLLVTRVAAAAAAVGVTLSTDEQLEMETLLAAHNYCCADRTRASLRTGMSSAVYDGKTGLGLDSTLYGQLAKMMDRSGSIGGIASGEAPAVAWLGIEPEE